MASETESKMFGAASRAMGEPSVDEKGKKVAKSSAEKYPTLSWILGEDEVDKMEAAYAASEAGDGDGDDDD